jgi:hypothetical protein
VTQADGRTPTPDEVRAQMRLLRPVLARLEAALTASARIPEGASIKRRFEALAELTAANDAVHVARLEMETSLGLPYDAVIEGVTYTAIFGPDD